MNNQEALELLKQELVIFRGESYAELAARIPSDSIEFERSAPSGATYQVEIQFMWDDRPGGDVRVMGSIGDGGWRAFVPLTWSFIKAPDGSFVDE